MCQCTEKLLTYETGLSNGTEECLPENTFVCSSKSGKFSRLIYAKAWHYDATIFNDATYFTWGGGTARERKKNGKKLNLIVKYITFTRVHG